MGEGHQGRRHQGGIASVATRKPLYALATQLRRVARKRNLAAGVRQINPTGKSPKTLSIPLAKNISLSSSGKSKLRLTPSCPEKRGVGHRHERWDG